MTIQRKTWVYTPSKLKQGQIPDPLKTLVEAKSKQLIETVLRPKYIKPPPETGDFSYLVDIYTKWYRGYFYFCGKNRCPAPNCIKEFSEEKFARMEYVGNTKFNLAYMRHTGKWWETHTELDIDKCLEIVVQTIVFF